MKFITHGNGSSGVAVMNINKYGLWLATKDHELFISFKQFPHFQDGSVRKLMNVEQPTPNRLHWPDLDIDLAVDSIRCFPLISTPLRATTRSTRQAKTQPITQSKSSRRSGSIRTSPKEQNTSLSRAPHFPNVNGHGQSGEGGTVQSTE